MTAENRFDQNSVDTGDGIEGAEKTNHPRLTRRAAVMGGVSMALTGAVRPADLVGISADMLARHASSRAFFNPGNPQPDEMSDESGAEPLSEYSDTTEEKPKLLRRRLTRREVVNGATVVTIVAATGGLAKLLYDKYEDRYLPGPVYEGGERDPSILSIRVQDGARIRSAPYVPALDIPQPNLLATVDLGDARDVVVPTPGGVYVDDGYTGRCFGIGEEDIAAVLDIDGISKDRDGIVWINWQKASIEDTLSEPQ